MNLLQMSITGAFMILAVVVVRALMINHLPKKTFLAMWIFVLVRLFVPLPFYSPFSIYTFLSGFAPHAVGSGIANSFPVSPVTPLEILPIYPQCGGQLVGETDGDKCVTLSNYMGDRVCLVCNIFCDFLL